MGRAIPLRPGICVGSTYAYHATVDEDLSTGSLASGDVAEHIQQILQNFRQNFRKSFLTTLKENAVWAPLCASVATRTGNVHGEHQVFVVLLHKLINAFVSVKCVT